ncbi:ribonuclease P protein subunit p20 [Fopius arisanus]|uniref:Ribonuclease P protein subunit p20 n=1 Tax=Fopius arisanus TaxID=64838 RepID=A0A9R1SV33_9HYME|nr:PREDICTED: ribonuclease P protein subunit p20 [Fopius arisanus]
MADEREDNKPEELVNVEGKSSKKIFDDSEHVLRKRPPYVFPKRSKDVYATNKTAFKAQLNICEKLLDGGEPEIIIHGLGAAINRACNLALQLKKNSSGTLDIDTRTSTVHLIDDLEPLKDDVDCEVNSRNNSAIHIRVFRTVNIGPLKYA